MFIITESYSGLFLKDEFQKKEEKVYGGSKECLD
jgi:hypothetical protein